MKSVYKETYRGDGLKITREFLPTVPSATGFHVEAAFIRAAGRMVIGEEELEYQDIRVILREGDHE